MSIDWTFNHQAPPSTAQISQEVDKRRVMVVLSSTTMEMRAYWRTHNIEDFIKELCLLSAFAVALPTANEKRR